MCFYDYASTKPVLCQGQQRKMSSVYNAGCAVVRFQTVELHVCVGGTELEEGRISIGRRGFRHHMLHCLSRRRSQSVQRPPRPHVHFQRRSKGTWPRTKKSRKGPRKRLRSPYELQGLLTRRIQPFRYIKFTITSVFNTERQLVF